MGRRNFSLIAIVLLLSAAPLHAQSTLITNGTLDTDASGWTLLGGCVPSVWDATNGNPPGSILMNSCGEPGSDPTAAQTVTGLTIGTTYTIKVDVHLHVAASGGGTGKSFGIYLNTQPTNPIFFAEFLDTSWHTVTTSFVATGASATIIFAAELDARTPGGPGSTTDVSYYIDNISLAGPAAASVPVPTMSEQALLFLAILLAACASLSLRKRRVRTQKTR